MNNDISIMRIEVLHDQLSQKSRTNWDKTSGKNSLIEDGLINLVYKVAKLVNITKSKVRKSKIYKEVISNSIDKNKWYVAVNKEL